MMIKSTSTIDFLRFQGSIRHKGYLEYISKSITVRVALSVFNSEFHFTLRAKFIKSWRPTEAYAAKRPSKLTASNLFHLRVTRICQVEIIYYLRHQAPPFVFISNNIREEFFHGGQRIFPSMSPGTAVLFTPPLSPPINYIGLGGFDQSFVGHIGCHKFEFQTVS